MSGKDLAPAVYTKAGLTSDGTTVEDTWTLASWVRPRLRSNSKAAKAAIEMLNDLTIPQFSNAVYLLSYDADAKTMGAWSVSGYETHSATGSDYVDDDKVFYEPKKGYWTDENGVQHPILTEISKTDGSGKFIGFLTNSSSDLYGALARPEYIVFEDFLGTGITVKVKVTYAGSTTASSSNNFSRVTGITAFYLGNTKLEAIVMSDQGFYYVDTALTGHTQSADAQSLYASLSGKLWMPFYESQRTNLTTHSKKNNETSAVDDMTWYASASPDGASLSDLPAGILRFCYDTGETTADGKGVYSTTWFFPCSYTVTFRYVTLSPADVILSQEKKADGTTVTTIDMGRGGDGAGESKVTILGEIDNIYARSVDIPSDTAWANGDDSAKTGYKITEALYVATDGTYYFREPTDLAGFVAWFNAAFGSKTITTGAWEKADVNAARTYIMGHQNLIYQDSAFASVGTDTNRLTYQLLSINIALLRDEYSDAYERSKAALNALNDLANYPQWLARQIANGAPNAQKALERLKQIGLRNRRHGAPSLVRVARGREDVRDDLRRAVRRDDRRHRGDARLARRHGAEAHDHDEG